MAGIAIDEVVLAAVRFVGDDDDIPAIGQDRMPIALLFRHELVDGREHHTACLHRQDLAQVGARLSLRWRLPQ